MPYRYVAERTALIVVLLAACGRFGFDDRAADATTGDAIDAGFGPWSRPVRMTDLDSAIDPDDDPTLTGDLLEVFWDSGRPPGSSGDVFTARRALATDPFGAASIVTELRSPKDDTTPDISPDGLTLYFASDRVTARDRDIFRSTRTDRSSLWSAPVRVVELSSPQDDGPAIETADGLSIYISSERTGAGDIYVATRTAPGLPWGTPALVPGLSGTPRVENQFWMDPTATLLYFTTTTGTGTDIWLARRSATDQPFGPPEAVDAINTIAADSDPWLSPDLRTLVFASDRDGSFDLYITTR